MDGCKSIPNVNKDIHLSLKTLKKATTYVEISAYNHLTPYANILCKRKRVQEKYWFNLKNNQCGNLTLNKTRFNCKSFLESEDKKTEKPHQIII